MAFESRSSYEFEDNVLAKARGERVAGYARAVASELFGEGLITDEPTARVVAFRILAELLYGNRAVDIPELRG